MHASPACRVPGFSRTTRHANTVAHSATYAAQEVLLGDDTAQQLASINLPTGTLSINERQWTTPKTLTFPGGSQQTRDYDALLRPTRIKVNDPGQATLIDRQYRYDPESNITQKRTELGGAEITVQGLGVFTGGYLGGVITGGLHSKKKCGCDSCGCDSEK